MLQVEQTVTIKIKKFKIKDAANFNIAKKDEKVEEPKQKTDDGDKQEKASLLRRRRPMMGDGEIEPVFDDIEARPDMQSHGLNASVSEPLTILEDDSDDEEEE
jgi:hypothetical protein